MKIAHIADIHFRNNKYHQEYKVAFEALYKKLLEIQPDLIVLAGDYSHSKVQISPEFVQQFSLFLQNVSECMCEKDIVVILGNHDGNLHTEKRLDAVTPLLELVKKNNIYLLTGTGTQFTRGNFLFTLKDCFDSKPVPDPAQWDGGHSDRRINILLYHGVVKGCVAGNGWVFDYGMGMDDIKKYDFAMLGDIHVTQALDKEGRYRYAGSLMQQNFGEDKDKGFLLWDIESPLKFSCEFIKIPECTMFYKYDDVDILLNDIEKDEIHIHNIPKFNIASERVVDKIEKAEIISKLKDRYNPSEIRFIGKSNALDDSVKIETSAIKEDVRKTGVQNELLKNYFADPNPELNNHGITIKDVIKVNESVDLPAEMGEIGSGKWELISFDMNNMFSYGTCTIDFNRFKNQIVGLLAPNKSGKSNLIESILFTIYQSTSKNTSRSAEVINVNEKKASGEIVLKSEDDEYYKITVKMVKTGDGKSAKTELSYNKCDEEGNIIMSGAGEHQIDTKKIIRNKFGTIDTATITSISPQGKFDIILNNTDTERGEILARFIGVDCLIKKSELAKPRLRILENKYKELQKADVHGNIKSAKVKLDELKEAIEVLREGREPYRKKYDEVLNELTVADVEKKRLEAEETKQCRDLVVIEKDISSVFHDLEVCEREIVLCNENVVRYNKYISNTLPDPDLLHRSLEHLKNQLVELMDYSKEEAVVSGQLKAISNQINSINSRIKILDDIVCPAETQSTCPLLKSALSDKDKKPTLQKEYEDSAIYLSEVSNKRIEVEKERDVIKKEIKAGEELQSKHQSYLNSIVKEKGIINQLESNKISLSSKLDKLNTERENRVEASDNKIKVKELSEKLVVLRKERTEVLSKIEHIDSQSLVLQRDVGKHESILENNNSILEELKKIQNEYYSYKLYTEAFSKYNIPAILTNKHLKTVNGEINKILSGLSDFGCYFKETDSGIDIVVDDIRGSRRIELCSGMERLMASLAIRAALTGATTLPSCSTFIIDEGFGALDSEYMSNVNVLMNNLKERFDSVLLVTHIESLKEFCDTMITVNVDEEGKSYVN